MDIGAITTLISSVGFPIAACCVMFYQNGKMQETLKEVSVTMQTLVTEINNIKYDINKKGE